jgi:DNA polymerase-3 subunit delta'
LKQAWGQQGSKLSPGGSKAVKELEKEQKSRTTRMVRDYLDRALLDIATFFRDVLLMQANSEEIDEVIINSDMQPEILRVATSSTSQQSLQKLGAIMKARMNLSHNANTLLTIEALMVQLR